LLESIHNARTTETVSLFLTNAQMLEVPLKSHFPEVPGDNASRRLVGTMAFQNHP